MSASHDRPAAASPTLGGPPPDQPRHAWDARVMGLLTLLLVAGALGWHLGAGSLPSSDDAIYAQMAREMVAGGDWLQTPWMGVPLFEKPPLLFWLLGVSGSLLGWTPLAMRLPGALAGALALGSVFRLARGAGAGPRGAAVAVAATVASVIFTMTTRRPLTDPLLVAASLGALDHAWRGHPKRAGLLLAAGALAKSVAVGPAAVAVAWALWRRGRRPGWARLAPVAAAAAVAAGPVAAWLAVMGTRYGAAFWETTFGYHVAARVSGALVGQDAPLYYARVAWEQDGWLAVTLGTGLIAGLGAIAVRGARALRDARARRAPPDRDPQPTRADGTTGGGAGPVALLTAWLTIAALQVVHTRLFHYLMPVVPLAAVVSAWAARHALRRPAVAWLAWAGSVAAFAVGPLPTHVAHPDYAPHAATLARGPLRDLPPDARVFVWEDYDPALVFLLNRRVEILTQTRPFYDIQQRVDMMRRARAVRWADPKTLAALAADPTPLAIVAPAARAAGLLAWGRQLSATRPVTLQRSADHVLLRAPRAP